MFKRFFYASAAVLMLAIAYHLGASSATAQGTDNTVAVGLPGGGAFQAYVVTVNGDVYGASNDMATWTLRSNVFGASPTVRTSWGALKVQSR